MNREESTSARSGLCCTPRVQGWPGWRWTARGRGGGRRSGLLLLLLLLLPQVVSMTNKGQRITALALNPGRKLLAFTEHGERPLLVVYDLQRRKRLKLLRCAEFRSLEVADSLQVLLLFRSSLSPSPTTPSTCWLREEPLTTNWSTSSGRRARSLPPAAQ